MIVCCLLSWFRIDWSGPFTVESRGGGPALDRALNGPPALQLVDGRKPRIGDYFDGGRVPR